MFTLVSRKEFLVLGLVLLACCFSGCRCGGKRLPPPLLPGATETQEETSTVETGPPPITDAGVDETVPRLQGQYEEIDAPELQTVYFDYDKADIRAQDMAVLDANAQWLKSHLEDFSGIKIEGHCDERGTNKYNMVLGEKRSNVVRDYLGKMGLPLSIIIPVSYGEERPADLGHTEEAWAKNRRAEFLIVVEK